MVDNPEISESTFKKRVLKDLRAFPNCWIFKTQEKALKGIPDVIGCIGGKFIAIELKRDGEKPTPIQLYRLSEITNAGGMAFWSSPSQWEYHYKVLVSSFTERS